MERRWALIKTLKNFTDREDLTKVLFLKHVNQFFYHTNLYLRSIIDNVMVTAYQRWAVTGIKDDL